MELMLALSDAPSDTVIAALRSGDEYLGAAAVLAILQGSPIWDTPQRGQLRTAVMHFQTTVSNPQIRTLAGDAQRALTRSSPPPRRRVLMDWCRLEYGRPSSGH